MRVYEYQPGDPGFVRAVHSVRSTNSVDDLDLTNWMTTEFWSRQQMRSDAHRRQALLAWEAGDDSAVETWRPSLQIL